MLLLTYSIMGCGIDQFELRQAAIVLRSKLARVYPGGPGGGAARSARAHEGHPKRRALCALSSDSLTP